ncbi:hypothetical protein BH10BAC4_BH10BAC4_11460 [soil metagenome]
MRFHTMNDIFGINLAPLGLSACLLLKPKPSAWAIESRPVGAWCMLALEAQAFGLAIESRPFGAYKI